MLVLSELGGHTSGRRYRRTVKFLRLGGERTVVEERVRQVAELGRLLVEEGVPVYEPTGGHAVYVDAERVLPHVPKDRYPGQALVCALYREGGVRGVELGGFAFPGTDRPDLVRLALPRRTYSREHLEHVAETAGRVRESAEDYRGLEVVEEPEMKELRHFSARLRPVPVSHAAD